MCSFALGPLLIQLCESIIEGVVQFVCTALLFLELFVEVAILILQEALGDPQLPNFLILGYNLDRMLTPFKAEF